MKGKKKKPASIKAKQSRKARKARAPGPTAAELRKSAVDTVEVMLLRGQIGRRQYDAAMQYRDAVHMCLSAGESSLADFDRVRGGGMASPTEAQLRAADLLSNARLLLGVQDYRLVSLVVAEGHSIEGAAGIIFGRVAGGKPQRKDAEHTGRRMREALQVLADAWFPDKSRMRAMRSSHDDESAAISGSIERGRVVHATRWRVHDI